MSINIENEEYINTDEAMSLLETSKQTFYVNARPLLQVYRFGAKKTPWYKKSDVLNLKSGKAKPRALITLSGILKDWTEYVRGLGMSADTINAEIVVTPLPPAAASLFNIDASRQFVKRQRVTIVEGAYLCVWDTYYPLELVEADLEKIKQVFNYSVVDGIKARHGFTIGYSKERYSARPATLREQEQMQLVTDEPILDLKRVSYTRDRQALILVSDMALRGTWFAVEREEEVSLWEREKQPLRPLQPQKQGTEGDTLPGHLTAIYDLIKEHGLTRQRQAIMRHMKPWIHEGHWKRAGHAVEKALDQEGIAEFKRRYVTQA